MDKTCKPALLPCPFCGRTDGLEIDDKEEYEERVNKYGRACLGVWCKVCHAEKNFHPIPGTAYEAALADLIEAWNTRKGANND